MNEVIGFIEKLKSTYERASLSDILSTLAFLIPLLFLASQPLLWAARKGYRSAAKQFEAENPHLKGQYFSFWKWFYIRDHIGRIGSKHYYRRFGEQNFVNTDSTVHQIRKLTAQTEGLGKKFSLPTKIAIVLLVAIMASGLII